MVDVHAENPLRHGNRQETSVFEAKYAPAGHDSNTRAEAAPATAEKLRGPFVRAELAEREWPQRAGTGQDFFVGDRVGLYIDRSRHHASRKRDLHVPVVSVKRL